MSKKGPKTAKEKHHENSDEGKNINQQNSNSNDSEVNENSDQDIKSGTNEYLPDESAVTSVESFEELSAKTEEAENKAREWQDKYIRLSAEFDNYRKRTLKEKADLMRYANEELLKKILPVIDDFERGIQIIDKSEDIVALKTGIHLIYNKLSEFIKQNGIKEIEAMNQPFDLDYHEAMTKIPAPTQDLKGKVVDVIEKGYILGDKVIRYAKVVVGE
jgi:molecular chaperone GrpE